MHKIKLAICTDGIYPLSTGGMQKHSRLLIEELSKDEVLDITVLHPHKEIVFDNKNVKEVFIEPIDTKKNYLAECYKYSKRIGAKLESLEYDVIYSQGLCVWAGIDRFKEKLIVNPHGLEPYQALGYKNNLIAIPFKKVFGYIFNKAAVVISLGGKLTDILKKCVRDKKKIKVIPNGVILPDSVPKRSFNTDKIRILFLARFAQNKGINILFGAIEQLEKQNALDDFIFTLAGTGPLYNYYLKKNNYPNVHLTGFVPDEKIDELYCNNDLFVLPTLFEGMPTVVLEAMSRRMPVIVSDVGATAELVNDNNGKLIEKGSIVELTKALLAFRDLPEKKKIELSEFSYNKSMQSFTWKSVAAKHRELFQQVGNCRQTADQ